MDNYYETCFMEDPNPPRATSFPPDQEEYEKAKKFWDELEEKSMHAAAMRMSDAEREEREKQKMAMMGVNEAFLTGDATYSKAEQSLTLFTESLNAMRQQILWSDKTKNLYDKLFSGMHKHKIKLDPGVLFNRFNRWKKETQ